MKTRFGKFLKRRVQARLETRLEKELTEAIVPKAEEPNMKGLLIELGIKFGFAFTKALIRLQKDGWQNSDLGKAFIEAGESIRSSD